MTRMMTAVATDVVRSWPGTQSMLRGVNRRRLFLFNDMLLLMGDEKKGRLSFHQAVPLASARIRDLMYTNAETTA